jgi:hypothetical protein
LRVFVADEFRAVLSWVIRRWQVLDNDRQPHEEQIGFNQLIGQALPCAAKPQIRAARPRVIPDAKPRHRDCNASAQPAFAALDKAGAAASADPVNLAIVQELRFRRQLRPMRFTAASTIEENMNMSDRQPVSDRWLQFRPTKTMTFWACVATSAATMAIGFGAAGWVTGGTAEKMVQNAAEGAQARLVADACVAKYAAHDSFAADLAALKKASSWKQGDIVADGGWATLAGMKEPLDDAARLCANKLVAMEAPVAAAPSTATAGTSPGS